jgi:pectinesterase
LFFEKKDITLIGEGPGKTVITWSDGAKMRHPDGRSYGTFRSYTAFMGGGRVQIENMSIVNACGDGRIAGQGLAVYADADIAVFKNVHLTAYQDTLFCAPLPPRNKDGSRFSGNPRGMSERTLTRQYFADCRIEGDVDFIFGGGDVVFDRCEIVSRNRNSITNGYVAAPSGFKGDLGFVFRDCSFTSSGGCADGTVFLGRPWRPEGKTALLRCHLGTHIHPEGWDSWGTPVEEVKATFCEYACDGPASDTAGRVSWCIALSSAAAEELAGRADKMVAECVGK